MMRISSCMTKASGFLKPGEYLVCRQSFGELMSCFIFLAAAWQPLVFCQNSFMHSGDFVNTSDFKYRCGISLLWEEKLTLNKHNV